MAPQIGDEVFFKFEELTAYVIGLEIYNPTLVIDNMKKKFVGVKQPGMIIGHLDGEYPPAIHPIKSFIWNKDNHRWEA